MKKRKENGVRRGRRVGLYMNKLWKYKIKNLIMLFELNIRLVKKKNWRDGKNNSDPPQNFCGGTIERTPILENFS
jgi:hypothetical protein